MALVKFNALNSVEIMTRVEMLVPDIEICKLL